MTSYTLGAGVHPITRDDVDALADWMLTEGRKRGGKPGTGLSPRTVQRTLAVFQKACGDAIDDRIRKLQAKEKQAAGEAYEDGGYVLCDELGAPLEPAKLRRVWYWLIREARVREVKPYTASRHAAGSYLANAGVSPDIIATWLGHTDSSFIMRTYVHARPEDLAAASVALAARLSPVGPPNCE